MEKWRLALVLNHEREAEKKVKKFEVELVESQGLASVENERIRTK